MAKHAFSQPKPTPKEVIESFCQTTTAHGIPKIIDATSYVSTFLWTSVILVALGLFCWQGGALVHAFFQWPFTTNVNVVTRQTLQFPAVTICNVNKLRRSKLVGTIYEDLIRFDGGYEDPQYSWWFSWPEHLNGEIPADGAPITDESVPFPMDDTSTDEAGDSSAIDTQLQPIEVGASTGAPPQLDTANLSQILPFRRKRSMTRERATTGSVGGEHKGRRNLRSKRQADAPPLPDEDVYKQFAEFDTPTDFEFYDFFGFNDVETENDWRGFYQGISESGDFSKWLDIINPPMDEVELMGHQEGDFIVQCSFDKKGCSPFTDFYKFQNNLYGNCYVFNHAVNMTTPRDTGKTGAQNGLHLVLFVEQPQYIGLLSQETGVRVAIHDPRSIPYPEDDGFTVPTGVSSSIGIRQSFIKRLPEPHGNCTSLSGANSNFSSTEFQYSRRACMKHCFQNHLLEKCGCVADISMEEPICSVINSTQQKCKQLAESLFQDDQLGCVCPTPCSEYGYRKTVSSATWPSERFSSHLVEALKDRNVNNMGQILNDVTLTRKNLVQLKIYFEELNYESIEQTPLYTIEGLLGSVGGLMGLYIGLSVISVAEISVFVCQFLRASWYKATDREKVKPFPDPRREPQATHNFNYGLTEKNGPPL